MENTIEQNLETSIENMLQGWEQITHGEWERYTKGSKTRRMKNLYRNKEKNLLLIETITEDRGSNDFFIVYDVLKDFLKLNNDKIILWEDDKERNSFLFDKIKSGDNWYDDMWKLGVFKGDIVVNNYVKECEKEIDELQSKITEIENNIKKFNK
jgi:hypothetical protein